MDIAYGVMPR